MHYKDSNFSIKIQNIIKKVLQKKKSGDVTPRKHTNK